MGTVVPSLFARGDTAGIEERGLGWRCPLRRLTCGKAWVPAGGAIER
jgi:hypothetical protein